MGKERGEVLIVRVSFHDLSSFFSSSFSPLLAFTLLPACFYHSSGNKIINGNDKKKKNIDFDLATSRTLVDGEMKLWVGEGVCITVSKRFAEWME